MEENKNNYHLGLPIHSQVRKIKQEYEKISDSSPPEPEMKPVLRELKRQQRSRSPLERDGKVELCLVFVL
ncbi:hypothetical protein HHK36_014801 [Tetracentron sinense]|uniref:Uncharacterized protein n=1 Tax=Tetracentron sinense TaxID=13715 RepID=A0A834Z526_TETSI|nr:hypothetical protein HHK36_014801 [Tetracentron sinense]